MRFIPACLQTELRCNEAELRFAIRKAAQGQSRLPFALYVRNDNRAPRLVKLVAMCGPLDMDAPEPAITIMMPDED